MKTKGTAWLMWFLGFPFAYLGDWKKQILYWVTFGGLGIWAIMVAIKLGDMVDEYNKAHGTAAPAAS